MVAEDDGVEVRGGCDLRVLACALFSDRGRRRILWIDCS